MKKNIIITYKDAGVDINIADEFVEKIKEIVKTYPTPNDKYIISGIGRFTGAFDLGAYWRDYLIGKYGVKNGK